VTGLARHVRVTVLAWSEELEAEEKSNVSLVDFAAQ
jgi:hypothetical protein